MKSCDFWVMWFTICFDHVTPTIWNFKLRYFPITAGGSIREMWIRGQEPRLQKFQLLFLKIMTNVLEQFRI